MQSANTSSLTQILAQRALDYRPDNLPQAIRTIAAQCILDWFSVTLAGLAEPVHQSLMDSHSDVRGGSSGIIGHNGSYPAELSALVNGATCHALDFDDVNTAILGHPTAVIFSALLALAEKTRHNGRDVLTAFVAGYETACQIGVLVCPDHLRRGFHSTGTLSGFGAGVACAHLLGFTPDQTARVMGIVGTRAAGLKSMFGTMVKPLHAGLAARRGIEAAQWVLHGVDSRTDILECPMGFASTHSSDFHASAVLARDPQDFHLRNNVFKYDASCFGTHAAIACARRIREQQSLAPEQIATITVRLEPSTASMCNVETPLTGLQGKFSLRFTTVLALLGIDTGRISTYSDEQVKDPAVTALQDKTSVQLMDGWPTMQAEVIVRTTDGATFTHTHDASRPDPDLERQGQALTAKFRRLADPVLGERRAQRLLADLQRFEDLADLRVLAQGCSDRGSDLPG